MGDKTKIEWTDATWNPVVGCSPAGGPGCDHCYAARETAGRLSNVPQYRGLAVRNADGVPEFTGEMRKVAKRLDDPFRWMHPRRVFVNSMSDLFHPEVLKMMSDDRPPTPFLAEILAVMVAANQHVFQVLTKRPPIMAAVLRDAMFKLDVNAELLRRGYPVMPGGMSEPETPWPSHMWFGTSIENDRFAFRADHLRDTPAALRFLSLEPLLGPLPSLDLTGIGWVIVGAESGPGARPMDEGWVREIRDRAVEAGVAFFYKQAATPNGRKIPTPTLDGRTWTEYPA